MQQMGTRNTKHLLLKYYMIAAVLAFLILVLIIYVIFGSMGKSNSGYALGISHEIKWQFATQFLLSLIIAYFLGSATANALVKGQSGIYVGIKSLLICWSAPCLLVALISGFNDVSLNFLLINGLIVIMPSIVIGPIVGLALKNQLLK